MFQVVPQLQVLCVLLRMSVLFVSSTDGPAYPILSCEPSSNIANASYLENY